MRYEGVLNTASSSTLLIIIIQNIAKTLSELLQTFMCHQHAKPEQCLQSEPVYIAKVCTCLLVNGEIHSYF